MVEYTYEEAVTLLESNLATALDKQVRVWERGKERAGYLLLRGVFVIFIVCTYDTGKLAVRPSGTTVYSVFL